ncbi:involucrin-like [Rhinatrema bivittatum]|uniref:involucrin-like n=1 Tax=Rhinatrema bivittatum TaxID=194408 RepID=UPI00112D0264|nr:involucrin-like [Rhinatrema bivittatum]
MDTAEKLAQFVAQVGPEIEKFSRENIANNPEFWFLNKRRSAAYRYYRMKVTEVCLSLGKSSYLEALKAEEDNLDHSESEESLTEEHMIMETQLSEPVIVKREMEEPKPGLQEHEAQDALLPAPKAEAGQVKEHAVEERKLTHSSEEVGLKEPKSEEIEQIKPEETPSLVPKAQEAPQPAPKDKEEREQMRHTEEVGLKEPKSEETEFIKTEEIPPLAPKTQETPQLVQKAEMDQVKECSVKEQAHTHNTEEAGLEPNSKETKLIKPEKAPQYLSKTQETSRLMPEAEAGQGKELEVEERKLTHNTEEAGLRELSSEETELIKTAEASQPLPKAQETPSPAPKAEAEQVTELTVEERELIKNSEEAELIKPEPKEPKSEETSSKPTEEAELKMELGSKTVETPAAEDSTPALESSTPTPVHYPVTRKRGQSMQQSVSSPKRVCATEEAQVVDSARTRSEKSRDRPGRLKTKLAGLESDSQAQSSPGMVLRKKGAKESPASTCAVKVGRTTGEGLGVAGKESMDDTL